LSKRNRFNISFAGKVEIMKTRLSSKEQIWLTIGLALVSFLFLYAYTFDQKIDTNGDNASYYILGKALKSGEGFVNLNSVFKTPNNHFPPGYPVIISLIMLVSESIIIIKLANGLLLLGSLFLSYLLVKKFSQSSTIAWMTLAFLIVNSHLLRYGTIMMSELPFLFFTLLALTVFLKTFDEDAGSKLKYYIIAFLCLMAAFYIRTLGIALLAAFLFMMARDYRKKWKYMIGYLVAFILLFFPWLARSNRLGGNSYLKQLIMVNPYQPEQGTMGVWDLFPRIVKNLERYIGFEIPDVIFPFKIVVYNEKLTILDWLSGVLILGLITLGIWKLPKYRSLIIIYLLSTFSILLIWPEVWVGIRFLLPLTPFLVMGMLTGFKWGVYQLSHSLNLKKTLPYWPVILILLLNYTEVQKLRARAFIDYEPQWRNYFSLAQSFRREGNDKMVVSCRKPALFYMYSGTYTTSYKFTPDGQELIEDLKERKADYVILDQLGYSSSYRYLYPTIQNYPDNFQIIAKAENPDTFLIKFVP
jgi:hypothetical protein